MRVSSITGALMPRAGWSKYVLRDPLSVGTIWRTHDGLSAISALTDLLLPGTDGLVGPTWHISCPGPAGARPLTR